MTIRVMAIRTISNCEHSKAPGFPELFLCVCISNILVSKRSFQISISGNDEAAELVAHTIGYLLPAVDDVIVGVQRCGDRRVAKCRADGSERDAVLDQIRSKCVSQIMEPKLRHACIHTQSVESFCQDVWRFEGSVAPAAYKASVDHPSCANAAFDVLFLKRQDQIFHALRYDELSSVAIIRFELIDHVPTHPRHILIQAIILHDVPDLTNQREDVPSKIEISELKAKHLSPSQSEINAKQHFQIDAVLLCQFKESLDFIWRDELPAWPFDAGKLHILARILRYNPIYHSLLQCASKRRVRELDARWR